jgi:hypothetical protein
MNGIEKWAKWASVYAGFLDSVPAITYTPNAG